METDIGVLFVDVRGYTHLTESRPPEEVAHLMDSFYALTTRILISNDALIDKLVGDEVMALFLPGFTGGRHMELMASSAEDILRGVGYGSPGGVWLPVGVGIDFGHAYVGNVGSGEVKDFTALGDVVNTAARLQGAALPGQALISERVYRQLPDRYPNARVVELELKGKSQPVSALVVDRSG